MAIEIRNIGDSFVKEVTGVQLWNDLDPNDLKKIKEAWANSGVLVFRRQALSEEDLVKASANFGEPEVVVRKDWASHDHPSIILVSNMKDIEGNQIGMPGTGDVEWHTDQSYVTNPATGAALYGVEIPIDGGGSTWWTNLYNAYDNLPDSMKARIEGRRAIFSYAKRLALYDKKAAQITEEQRRKTPDITHPIVTVHPVTGRKCLYFDPATTDGIEGMDKDEGIALLEELKRLSTLPELVYKHQWQVGDVVLWDNGCTLHRRDSYESKLRRFHKRTTIRLSPQDHIIPETELYNASAAA